MARRARNKVTIEGNSARKTVTVMSIIKTSAFGRGFTDMKKGRPFDDSITDITAQWHYERGRILGCVYAGKLKDGRNVLDAAIAAYRLARNDGTMI